MVARPRAVRDETWSEEGLRPRTGGLTPPRSEISHSVPRGVENVWLQEEDGQARRLPYVFQQTAPPIRRVRRIAFVTEAGFIREWVLATRPVIDTDHSGITIATCVPCARFIPIRRDNLARSLSRGNEVWLSRQLLP